MSSASGLGIYFDNRAHRKLPVEPKPSNPSLLRTPRRVPGACFAHAMPIPLSRPALVAYSRSALSLLGINPPDDNSLGAWERELTDLCSGASLPSGCVPLAHCYCGHQFGSFAGQLGDGAAVSLGEVTSPGDGSVWEVHLKGTGPTAFSRGADGRKVLRSTIREFLCSEAMHYLGIPTTRAAACVTSDTTVERDPQYTGNIVREKCAVVCRLAPSFFRFGSFEICNPANPLLSSREGPSAATPEVLEKLFDFVGETFFPQQLTAAKRAVAVVESAASEGKLPPWKEQSAVNILRQIVGSTASLVANWQACGFAHGVLNTDNMSIHGLTIDYGPYAFMTYYDPDFVPNTSDHDGRYSFANQPSVCLWNLERFAESLAVLFPNAKPAMDEVLRTFQSKFDQAEISIWRAKLGLPNATDDVVRSVKERLHLVMRSTWADFNKSIHALGTELRANYFTLIHNDKRLRNEYLDAVAQAMAFKLCPSPSEVALLLKSRGHRRRSELHPEQTKQLLRMAKSEPHVVSAIFGGAPVLQVIAQLETELAKQAKDAERAAQLAQWQSMDQDAKLAADVAAWKGFLEYYTVVVLEGNSANDKREALMQQSNPVFILYPWILEAAIAAAERGDFSLVRELVIRVQRPFDVDARDDKLWSMRPPQNVAQFCVSCSS